MTETSDIADKLTPQINDLKLDEPPEETNWNNLPLEMKEIVVREMDYITRIRFKQCSRESKWLSESMPYHLNSVVAICGGFGIGTPHVYIDGRKIKKRDIEANFNTKLLSANVQIKYFSTQWNVPKELEDSAKLIRAKNIRLSHGNVQEYGKWLDHMAPGVENVIITLYHRDLWTADHTAEHPIVINAKNVQLYNIVFKPDQLVEFKATKLNIQHGWIETDDLIRFLKKWIDEDYPVGSELFVNQNHSEFNLPIEDCLRRVGLQYSMRRRPFNNRIEITIPMNSKKYIEILPIRTASFSIFARVRQVPAKPPLVSTTNWNNLPMKIKGMIVEKMDYITRTCLKVCSKSDKQLVESTPLHLKTLKACEDRETYFLEIDDILLQGDEKHLNIGYKLPFHRDMNIKRHIVYNRWDAAHNQLKKIINSFVTNKNVTVDYAEFSWWPLVSNENVPIMKAKKLTLVNADISDDQMLRFNSTQLKVKSYRAEKNTVDKIIEKWIAEDYPVGSQFSLAVESTIMRDWLKMPYDRPSKSAPKRRIPMNSEKFIELTFILTDDCFKDSKFIGKVCQVPVESPADSSTNWNDLPDKVKGMIVGKMDLFTRTRFKMCSKSDQQLVESTPLNLSSMKVFAKFDRFEIDDDLKMQVAGKDILVCNEWHRIKCESNEEARDRLKMIVNSFVNNGNLTVDTAEFNGVRCHEIHPMMHARKIIIENGSVCDDVHGFKLEALKIAGTKVTNSCINRLLKNIIDKDYQIGSKFHFEDVPWVKSIDDITEGLKVSKVDGKYFIRIDSNKAIEVVLNL